MVNWREANVCGRSMLRPYNFSAGAEIRKMAERK